MRLVLDTNTAISGLLWGGTPGQLIEAALSSQIDIIGSTPLLAELQGVLAHRFDKVEFTTRYRKNFDVAPYLT